MAKDIDPILFKALVERLERFVNSDEAKKVRYQLGKQKRILAIGVRIGKKGEMYLYTFCSLGLTRFRKLGIGIDSVSLSPEEFLEELSDPSVTIPLERIIESCERTVSILTTGDLEGFSVWQGPEHFGKGRPQ